MLVKGGVVGSHYSYR